MNINWNRSTNPPIPPRQLALTFTEDEAISFFAISDVKTAVVNAVALTDPARATRVDTLLTGVFTSTDKITTVSV